MADRLTTLAKGKDFEARVASALELRGYRVSHEQLVGHARVDLVARFIHFERERKLLVECKNTTKQLSRKQVVAIWTDLQPLLDRGDGDEVLIVSAAGLAPSAIKFVDETRGLEAQSLAQLFAGSLVFDSYLAALEAEYAFSPDGLPSYYIPPTDVTGADIDAIIREWIRGEPDSPIDPHRPIAVLGAYGLGKTSFATHLAAELAAERVADITQRVPVLIRLQEITGEQSLEGLLGKHFTATHDVAGYSFHKLMTLNRNGHLVVIFDGFDEMRQMLSWREFKHNLGQLNRMCIGDARVIILGRPTAFETDAQQRSGLHGERIGPDGAVRRDPGWPDYFELELAPLSAEACKTFLQRYLDARSSVSAAPETFNRLWASVNSNALRDIARRPVQLRMLAEILPNYSGDVDKLDLVTVYDIFVHELIERIIAREEEKNSRLAFSSEERRGFLRSVAFWLWTTGASGSVLTEAIPDELVRPFVRDVTELEATRRDLVVGSPLDRRLGERISFPHRSFQEFLVAEELWDRISGRAAQETQVPARERAASIIHTADGAMSREVSDFMQMLRAAEHDRVARRLLVTYEGSMSARLAKTLYFSPGVVEDIRERVRSNKTDDLRPWELLVLATATKERTAGTSVASDIERYSARRQEPIEHLLALFCLLLMGESTPSIASMICAVVARILGGQAQIERIQREYGGGKRRDAALRGDMPSGIGREQRMQQREEFDPLAGQARRRGRREPGRPARRERLAAGASGGTIESRRLVPAGGFVIAGHDGPLADRRIGAVTGSGQLRAIGDDRYALSGSSVLQVRWLPDWGATFVRLLQRRHKGKTLWFDGLHSLFAEELAAIAFMREWTEAVDLNERLDLTPAIDVPAGAPSVLADLEAVQEALSKAPTRR